MPNRRQLLVGAAALAATPAFGAVSPDAVLSALLARHMDEYLTLSPQAAADLLTDARGRAARHRLDDRSLEGKARDLAAARRWRKELAGVNRAALSPAGQVEYDTAAFAYEMLDEVGARYGFQDHALRPGPYLISQMSGDYYWLPEDYARAPMAEREDAQAYLDRFAAFATALDQETERVRFDASQGVIPPDFVLDRIIAQLSALRAVPAERSDMAAGPAARAAAKGWAEVGPKATAILANQIQPALDRQIALFQSFRAKAVHEAGVWRLPEGEAWYALALKSNTTVSTPPFEMHQLGLDTFAALSAELDSLLRAQGMTQGSVGERIRSLDKDPRFLKPDTDAGRAELLTYARDHLAHVHDLLPRAFRTQPDRDITVDRVPVAIEAGAPGAYYSGPPADGSRPGVIAINLKTTDEWPLWRLATLTHHEGDPGHHLQHAVFRKAAPDAPLYRSFAQYSAYVEGWALYAEHVAVEIGAYENDPFGRIGAVQSALFRAARIVVDTGIHAKRWSREEATRWMVENAGEQQTSAQREIDRYCVYPGQACAFMVGRIAFLKAREAARARLGARFDVRDFHERVLAAGPAPMQVVARMTQDWQGG
ncbi:MAG TPA: DUF885 family protein [Phenylobacterium sp.]|nr:DUF885 family protein [Phenylobacterium sp.]